MHLKQPRQQRCDKDAYGECQPLKPSEEDMSHNDRTGAQDEKVVLKEDEAKQGLELGEMRYVLAFGTAGAVAALAVAGYVFL
jgi:hypothetical protein